MSWSTRYIAELKEGKTISFRPVGHSMEPRIKSRALVTVKPLQGELAINDVVLCKVNGKQYLHIVKALKPNQALIGNNKGGINGWTHISNIYGICIKIEE